MHEALHAHRLRRRYAERAGRAGDSRCGQEGRLRARARARRRSASARATASSSRRHAGRRVHGVEPGRHRRHGLHADHQRARGRDPRRVAQRMAAGVSRRSVRAAADVAAVAVVRSSRHRRREGRAVHDRARRDCSPIPRRGCSRRFRERRRGPRPRLGDFDSVDVIDVHVEARRRARGRKTRSITLETDKATMDVPAPRAARSSRWRSKVGDKVAAGDR